MLRIYEKCWSVGFRPLPSFSYFHSTGTFSLLALLCAGSSGIKGYSLVRNVDGKRRIKAPIVRSAVKVQIYSKEVYVNATDAKLDA